MSSLIRRLFGQDRCCCAHKRKIAYPANHQRSVPLSHSTPKQSSSRRSAGQISVSPAKQSRRSSSQTSAQRRAAALLLASVNANNPAKLDKQGRKRQPMQRGQQRDRKKRYHLGMDSMARAEMANQIINQIANNNPISMVPLTPSSDASQVSTRERSSRVGKGRKIMPSQSINLSSNQPISRVDDPCQSQLDISSRLCQSI